MIAAAASSCKELREEFETFRARSMDARRLWNLYTNLYADEENIELLRRVANAFFADIQELVIRQLIMEVCALTDPATMGSSNKNLSIKRIQNRMQQCNCYDEDLNPLVLRLTAHGRKLRPARDKIIAHADLRFALSGDLLGQATDDEWLQWWADLQAFCDETGKAIRVGPLDFRAQAEPGDALDLLKFLRSADRAGVSGNPSRRFTSDE